jgi:hypothetical protein
MGGGVIWQPLVSSRVCGLLLQSGIWGKSQGWGQFQGFCLFLPLLLQGLQEIRGTVDLTFVLADCLSGAVWLTTDLQRVEAGQIPGLRFVGGLGGAP